MSKIGIGILGAAGRMGQMTFFEVLADDDTVCTGMVVRPGSAAEGNPVMLEDGKTGTGHAYVSEKQQVFDASSVVVDFSTVEAGMENLALAQKTGTAIAIGITGFSDEQLEAIRAAGENVPVLLSYNMSFGITALARAIEGLSDALGPDFHVEISDIHHTMKKDAPSGTALMIGDATGRARDDIKYTSERTGNVIGEHTVLFSGPAEQIEITHKAKDRRLFAKGAVLAAKWLAAQPPGFYTLKDVLEK